MENKNNQVPVTVSNNKEGNPYHDYLGRFCSPQKQSLANSNPSYYSNKIKKLLNSGKRPSEWKSQKDVRIFDDRKFFSPLFENNVKIFLKNNNKPGVFAHFKNAEVLLNNNEIYDRLGVDFCIRNPIENKNLTVDLKTSLNQKSVKIKIFNSVDDTGDKLYSSALLFRDSYLTNSYAFQFPRFGKPYSFVDMAEELYDGKKIDLIGNSTSMILSSAFDREIFDIFNDKNDSEYEIYQKYPNFGLMKKSVDLLDIAKKYKKSKFVKNYPQYGNMKIIIQREKSGIYYAKLEIPKKMIDYIIKKNRHLSASF